MGTATRIEWTDTTWNPVTGCTRVSAGCERCYIERTPPLRMAGRRFDRSGPGGATGVLLHPDRLTVPLRWQKPRRVFVCSLADVFHASVPDVYLAQVWAVMALAGLPRMSQMDELTGPVGGGHTFQVLTKRHARLRAWLGGPGQAQVLDVLDGWSRRGLRIRHGVRGQHLREGFLVVTPQLLARFVWPLPNVWVGVSAETQPWADLRLAALMATPAAVRWVSAEPLLGPLELSRWLRPLPDSGHVSTIGDGCCWHPGAVHALECHSRVTCPLTSTWRGLDWVVTGGESGPGARGCDPDWVRAIRDDCQIAGVAFFHKQWGGPRPRALGRVLDGRTHHAYPDTPDDKRAEVPW